MNTLSYYLELIDSGINNLNSDYMFYEILKNSEYVLKMSSSELANGIQLSVPTITGYKNGTIIPNPIMRKSIYLWLKNKTNLINEQKGG